MKTKRRSTALRITAILSVILLVLVNTASVDNFAYAAKSSNTENAPGLVYYRTKANEEFDGEVDISKYGTGDVTDVVIDPEEDPSAYIYDFDNSAVYFDSLFRAAEHTLIVSKNERNYKVAAEFAVYDLVTLEKTEGSVTLTVKDNRTLSGVPDVVYALYSGDTVVKSSLRTDSSGKITVVGLQPGDYELRQVSSASGYMSTDKPVSFTISGIELSGGDEAIRTTAGKKVNADEDEALIAGTFSDDIALTATKEEQIQTITLTYKAYGASLEKAGKAKIQTYSSVAAAQDALNEAKNNGFINGPVTVSYALSANANRSTCNYIQYIEKKPQATAPTPIPVSSQNPNGNDGQGGSPSAIVTPLPVPTPTPQATGTLTVVADTDSGAAAEGYLFEVLGAPENELRYNMNWKTNETGQFTVELPIGTYTVSFLDNSMANKGVIATSPQTISITTGSKMYLHFTLQITKRDLAITVMDDEGVVLKGVQIGIYDPADFKEIANISDKSSNSDATDISKALENRETEAENAEKRKNPYTIKNAIDVYTTGSDGIASFSEVPVKELTAVVLAAPDGYAVTGEAHPVSAGWDSSFTMLCQYVTVEIGITGAETGQRVLGAKATLTNSKGKEITSWTIKEEPEELIRVPQGKYGLVVSYEDKTEELSFEVTDTEAVQTVSLISKLTGDVELPPPEEPEEKTPIGQYVLFGIVLVAVVALVALLIRLIKHKRRRIGGMK